MKSSTISITLLLTLLLSVFTGCESVPQPKGTSQGYTSASFVTTGGIFKSDNWEDSPVVNQMIQQAIADQFKSHGIAFEEAGAELDVAYIILSQNSALTVLNDDHFGQGRNAASILHEAHKRGVIDQHPGYSYDAGAVVIDILDANTGKLIYRDFAKRDIIRSPDVAIQRKRVNEAVAEALEKFFK